MEQMLIINSYSLHNIAPIIIIIILQKHFVKIVKKKS